MYEKSVEDITEYEEQKYCGDSDEEYHDPFQGSNMLKEESLKRMQLSESVVDDADLLFAGSFYLYHWCVAQLERNGQIGKHTFLDEPWLMSEGISKEW